MKANLRLAAVIVVTLMFLAMFGPGINRALWGPGAGLMTPTVATAQGANYRFSVAGYGGAISTSPAYASLSDCNTAHNALASGWPMTGCIYTSGQ